MGSLTLVNVPDIGDSHDVPVIEILIKEGDIVEKDQSLLVLESDKATVEVPSPCAGTVRSIKVKVGDKLSGGSPVCELETDAEEGAAAAPAAPAAEPPPAAAEPVAAPAPAPAAAPAAAPAPAPASATQQLQVQIPEMGDNHDVPVIEILVKEGDVVEKEQSLLVLESDKATMDVPSPEAGTVSDLRIKVGDKVNRGDLVCTLATRGGSAAEPAATPTPSAAAAAAAPVATARVPAADSASASPVPAAAESPMLAASGKPGQQSHAGPATRKFARELGADLTLIKGSGPKGRITIEDVQAFVKQSLKTPAASPGAAAMGSGIPPIPAVDFSLFGETESKPLARIRKFSAAHLHRAWVNIPHVTQTDEVDITDLEAFRKQMSDEIAKSGGPKITLLPIVMKVVAKAMEDYPEFNSSLSPDGESLIMKKYTHIGFAADTPNGLVVPVVRDVNRKGVVALAAECAELARKARDGKLKPDEMKGGCFSISSLGGIGGGFFSPIVNGPEVGILGVSRGVMKPVWDGQAFQPRLMLPLSLSYDHRVIDGAYGARFIVQLGKLLSDLRRWVL